jgi:hypothetical protein
MRSYLNERVAASVQEIEINGRGEPPRWPRYTSLSAKFGIESPRPGAVARSV